MRLKPSGFHPFIVVGMGSVMVDSHYRLFKSGLPGLVGSVFLASVASPALAQSDEIYDAALRPPAYQAVGVPAMPDFRCSEAERQSLAQLFAIEASKAFANMVAAEGHLQAVAEEIDRFAGQGRPAPRRLIDLRRNAEAEFSRRRAAQDEAHARLQRAAALPIARCRPAEAATAAAEGSLEDAFDREAIERADRSGSHAERRAVVAGVIEALRARAATSADAWEVAAALELGLDRDRLLASTSLEETIATVEGSAGTARTRSLDALGAEVLDRARHFTQAMGRGEYEAEDAARLLNIAKYAAQLGDDIGTPRQSLTGENAGKVSAFLSTAYGVAAVVQGSRDGDARIAMDGIRDLFAQSNSPAWTAVDLPGEVAASILNTSRSGMDKASGAVDALTAAMEGDPEAVEEAIALARDLEGILSSQSYGRAMKEAITSRLIDRVPLLRTVMNWFPDAGGDRPAASPAPAGRVAVDVANFAWHWSARHRLLQEGSVVTCGPKPAALTPMVYGTEEYWDASTLCGAAVHAGEMDWSGGSIRIRYLDPSGEPFRGSWQHGVQSSDYPGTSNPALWKRRFTVERVSVD